nr:MAG TPA: hypothetical protein [Caudoviricetes sp.]
MLSPLAHLWAKDFSSFLKQIFAGYEYPFFSALKTLSP